MSVDLGNFTKIPSKFFGSGMASKLGVSASLLYIALCEHANRNSCNAFKASDKAVASDTGLGTRTICEARKTLQAYGLITCAREPGQSHKYKLLLVKLDWVKLKDRPRQKMKPRAYHAERSQPA